MRPPEPVLEVSDIQANVLAGLDTRQQLFLFLEFGDPAAARRWLADLIPAVTTVAQLRAGRTAGRPMVNLALTYAGLGKLTGDADGFHDLPFREGMHVRSKLLGDPITPEHPGHRDHWVVGGPHNVPDMLLILAGDDPAVLAAAAALPDGVRLIHRDHGSKLPAAREHFGFRDPVSQPGVRGLVGDDYLTPRRNPANPDHGQPGQNLIWPGEFVFGYPQQDPMDPAEPGLIARAGPPWARNGSYLVMRRLRQDVAAFHDFLRAAAELASGTPGLGKVSQEQMAAKILGRWADGTPLMLSPDGETEGIDETRLNDFGYAGDDPLGLLCPPAAHVRKVYPRDHATSMDTVESMDTHRLLRRGVPFGPPYPEPGERGLLFVAYQTSIDRQFEFITRSWLNNPNLRDFRDGHDPIAGQRAFGLGARDFAIPYRTQDGAIDYLRLEMAEDWTVVTGGGYFFAPSISGLQHLTRPDTQD